MGRLGRVNKRMRRTNRPDLPSRQPPAEKNLAMDKSKQHSSRLAAKNKSRTEWEFVGIYLRCCLLLSLVASGCSGTASPPDPPPAVDGGTVTFHQHVAPIIFEHCAGCHRPNASTPFSLLTFEQVQDRALQIMEVTSSGFMPPWLPEPGYGKFKGERRLEREQIEIIRRWVAGGAVEGDPLDSPPPPTWIEGWQLGEPDLVIELSSAYTLVADGSDVFRNFVLPVPLTIGRYVRAVEFRPGNPKVIHHAVIQIDDQQSCRLLDENDPEPGFGGMDMGSSRMPEGHFLGWSPGKKPSGGTPGMSWRLEKDTDLVLQLHLRPSGKPEEIQPRVGFYFTDEPPWRIGYGLQLHHLDIDIVPGAQDYRIENRFTLPVDAEVLGVYPHAHYLGKQLHGFAELADGSVQWLFKIDDWDFNWQDDFRYSQPVSLSAGSTIVYRYSFDNSSKNVRNPHSPPQRVVFGTESHNEMANLWLQVVLQDQGDLALLKRDLFFHDRNHRIAYYTHLVQDDPQNMGHHLSLAHCYKDLGKVKLATEHFQRGIGPDTTDPYAHVNFGIVLHQEERHEESIAQFRLALQLRQDLPYTHFFLANALRATGQSELAATHYRLSIQYDPNLYYSHNGLGIICTSQGRFQEAVHHFQRAIQIKPDFPEASRNLTLAKQKLTGSTSPE